MDSEYAEVEVERIIAVDAEDRLVFQMAHGVVILVPLKFIADGDVYKGGYYGEWPQTIEVWRDIAEKHHLI